MAEARRVFRLVEVDEPGVCPDRGRVLDEAGGGPHRARRAGGEEQEAVRPGEVSRVEKFAEPDDVRAERLAAQVARGDADVRRIVGKRRSRARGAPAGV